MTVMRESLQDPLANDGDDDLGQDHDYENCEQDDRNALPLEEVERRIERHAYAAGTNQAEHRGFADVDVPAKQRDRPERRLDLRPVAEGEPRQRGRAGRVQRLDGAMAGLLERLSEQLADEADRAE